MSARHSWRPDGAHNWTCAKCPLRRRWNTIRPSRPLFSTDGGRTWGTTEYGYVPPCEPKKEGGR